VHAFTILITSPNRERWSEFNRESDCARLFFPVFSWEEIQQLQEGCFPGVTGVIERFLVWGGIPRYVLAKLGKDDQNQIYAALTSPDYRLLAECLDKKEMESDAATSHRLLHLKVRGEFDSSLKTTSSEFYELCRTELGSTFIADKVCEALMASADNQLRSLLALSPRSPSAAKLYGEVFERYSLKTLAAGGTFRIRLLQPDGRGAETDLELPSAVPPVAGFRTVEELKELNAKPGAASRLLRPTSKSFCAVDFILQGKRLANATVNRSHGLIVEGSSNTPSGLLPVAEAMGLVAPVPFYWIVPEADFNDWKRPQSLMMKGGADNSKKTVSMVEQYALAVPFEVLALTAAGRARGVKRKAEEEGGGEKSGASDE
jgi:hypothetical protein